MINLEKLNRKSVCPRFQEDLSVYHTSIPFFNISDTPGEVIKIYFPTLGRPRSMDTDDIF